MAKKISIVTTLGGGTLTPDERQDCWKEAIQCYSEFADEVIIVNGDGEEKNGFIKHWMPNAKFIYYKWPEEFDWHFIGQQFNRGYEAATGDWVIKLDIDQFLHEDDFEAIREFLKLQTEPVCKIAKRQFLRADYFSHKAFLPFVLNKGEYGDRIKLDSGADFCEPSLDGKHLNLDEMPIVAEKVPVVVSGNVTAKQIADRLPNSFVENEITYSYSSPIMVLNYDYCFKNKEVIKKEFARFGRAWFRTFKNHAFSQGKEETAVDDFLKLMKGRWNKRGWTKCEVEDHPKYVRDRIRNLTPDRFGYDGFGELK